MAVTVSYCVVVFRLLYSAMYVSKALFFCRKLPYWSKAFIAWAASSGEEYDGSPSRSKFSLV